MVCPNDTHWSDAIPGSEFYSIFPVYRDTGTVCSVSLNEAKNVLTSNPVQMLAPGIAIVLVVSAFNLMGDAAEDYDWDCHVAATKAVDRGRAYYGY